MADSTALATKETPSTDVAVPLTGAALAQIEEFEAYLLGDKEPPEVDTDPAALEREMLKQLLAAESDAELETFGQAVGWRELARRYVKHDSLEVSDGVPVMIRDFTWRPSQIDGEGHSVFVVVSAVRVDTGEVVAITTGAGGIMAILANRKKRGTLSGWVCLATEPEKPTQSGRYPMHLVSLSAEEIGKLRRVAEANAAANSDLPF